MVDLVNLVAFFPIMIVSGLLTLALHRPFRRVPIRLKPGLSEFVFGTTISLIALLLYTSMNCAFLIDLPFTNRACAALGW